MWQEVGRVLAEDFSDLPDLAALVRLLVRLAVAAVAGGLLGWERELARKAAGLRTHMLVGMGAAVFVFAAEQAGIGRDHLSRVIQGVVAGIGLLCAGAILKVSEKGVIHGLTTAASLWLAAGVGLAAGLGREVSALVVAVLAFAILFALGKLEFRLEGAKGPDGAQKAGEERHEK
jgi:putative Mg2+ transporter-C (MgtC) family protein